MTNKPRLTMSKELVLANLSQSDLRAIRKVANAITFTPEDVLKQRYYHHDKKTGENYANGDEIIIGTHGPERKNGNLYITIYHYLEYVCKEPSVYKTVELGGYLTTQSLKLLNKLNPQYIPCKYGKYPHVINKFELAFLRKEEQLGIFEKYKKG